MLLLYENKFLFQVVLAGAFYPNYFTFGPPDEEMAVRELAGKDPKTTVVVGGEEQQPSLGREGPCFSNGGSILCANRFCFSCCFFFFSTKWIFP